MKGSNLPLAFESQDLDRQFAYCQTPYFLQRQKSTQKGLLLRRALLSPVVGVLFAVGVDDDGGTA